jgi:hypothetical protein
MPEIRIRNVAPSELLPEERAIQNGSNHPFLGPADRPEPYRTQCIAYERLKAVFQKEKLVSSPLVVNTPLGQALVWRWWPREAGVVLILSQNPNGTCQIDSKVTFVDPATISLDLTKVVIAPPDWGKSRE